MSPSFPTRSPIYNDHITVPCTCRTARTFIACPASPIRPGSCVPCLSSSDYFSSGSLHAGDFFHKDSEEHCCHLKDPQHFHTITLLTTIMKFPGRGRVHPGTDRVTTLTTTMKFPTRFFPGKSTIFPFFSTFSVPRHPYTIKNTAFLPKTITPGFRLLFAPSTAALCNVQSRECALPTAIQLPKAYVILSQK